MTFCEIKSLIHTDTGREPHIEFEQGQTKGSLKITKIILTRRLKLHSHLSALGGKSMASSWQVTHLQLCKCCLCIGEGLHVRLHHERSLAQTAKMSANCSGSGKHTWPEAFGNGKCSHISCPFQKTPYPSPCPSDPIPGTRSFCDTWFFTCQRWVLI